MKALRVITSEGGEAILDEAAVREFAASLRGPVLLAGDRDYDEARKLFNGMIDHRPAVIARCTGAADVVAAVRFAREHDLRISMKGGGHGVAGKAVCDGGLTIEFSRMKSIRVDPAARIVRAEPGVIGAELDRETQAFALATPVGTVSTTGIAGLTLGGGQSWLASKHGFAIDNLLSVDIVTADGTLRSVSATQHEDLFWAVRGAGHNFGVVTSFEYRLHPVGPVLGGLVIHPLSQAVEVLRFYREFTASQPDELQTWAGILTLPDGNKVVALVPFHMGSLDQGERLVAPLRRFGNPMADTVGRLPYVAMQQIFDAAFPPGRLNYWKSATRSSKRASNTRTECPRRSPPFSSPSYTAPIAGWARPKPRTSTVTCNTTRSSYPAGPAPPTRHETSTGRESSSQHGSRISRAPPMLTTSATRARSAPAAPTATITYDLRSSRPSTIRPISSV